MAGMKKETTPIRIIIIPDTIKALFTHIVSAINPVFSRPIIEGSIVALP